MPTERRSGAERRQTVTVVVVDEDPLTRSALAQTLSDNWLDVVGEAANGEAAIELVLDLRPDVVLTEITLPGMSGVEAIRQMGLLAPASRVLVLTRSKHNQVVQAIMAGATGYILKTAPSEAIVAAVRATAAGECVLDSEIAGTLLERIRERDIPVIATGHPTADAIRAALTTRELEIFTRLASGKSNQQIGDALSLSSNTVANHVKSILDKLHLDNRIQAAVKAVRASLS
jgi:DNA-binding NarL/FixJ family response regulator